MVSNPINFSLDIEDNSAIGPGKGTNGNITSMKWMNH